jgi:hypothetical protein
MASFKLVKAMSKELYIPTIGEWLRIEQLAAPIRKRYPLQKRYHRLQVVLSTADVSRPRPPRRPRLVARLVQAWDCGQHLHRDAAEAQRCLRYHEALYREGRVVYCGPYGLEKLVVGSDVEKVAAYATSIATQLRLPKLPITAMG